MPERSGERLRREDLDHVEPRQAEPERYREPTEGRHLGGHVHLRLHSDGSGQGGQQEGDGSDHRSP
jgi:hypothetical protein